MITSQRQLEAAQKQLILLEESLLAPTKKEVPDIIVKSGKAQVKELIDDLQQEIAQYTNLLKAQLSDIHIKSVDDLMLVPIKYRLVSHMSVEAFARLVDVSVRQITRYESEAYQNCNTSTFKKILLKLNIDLAGKVA